MEGLLILAILLMIAGYETAALFCVAPAFLYLAFVFVYIIYSFIANLFKGKS